MKRIFLLFGASGELGSCAAEYFPKKEYDRYYFFGRGEIKIHGNSKKVEIIKISDLSEEKNVENAFLKVEREVDASYFLFSTIGGFYSAGVEETKYENWLKMLNINLNPAFLISKHFVKLVKGTAGGSICFTSAYSSFQLSKGKAAYNVSKNALNYFIQSFALEAKSYNVSVNAVAPFAIDSASNREWIDDVSRLITPQQICDVVESLFMNHLKINGNIIGLP